MRFFRISVKCPIRVKLRRTQSEQMFSALPSNSDIARRIRHVSKVPTGEVEIGAKQLLELAQSTHKREARLIRGPLPRPEARCLAPGPVPRRRQCSGHNGSRG